MHDPEPDLPPEMDAKLREIEERAKIARHRQQMAENRTEKARRSDAEAARGLGLGLTGAYALLGTPIVGWGIGKLIDSRIGGGGKGWETGLTMAGFAMGLAYIILVVQKRQS